MLRGAKAWRSSDGASSAAPVGLGEIAWLVARVPAVVDSLNKEIDILIEPQSSSPLVPSTKSQPVSGISGDAGKVTELMDQLLTVATEDDKATRKAKETELYALLAKFHRSQLHGGASSSHKFNFNDPTLFVSFEGCSLRLDASTLRTAKIAGDGNCMYRALIEGAKIAGVKLAGEFDYRKLKEAATTRILDTKAVPDVLISNMWDLCDTTVLNRDKEVNKQALEAFLRSQCIPEPSDAKRHAIAGMILRDGSWGYYHFLPVLLGFLEGRPVDVLLPVKDTTPTVWVQRTSAVGDTRRPIQLLLRGNHFEPVKDLVPIRHFHTVYGC